MCCDSMPSGAGACGGSSAQAIGVDGTYNPMVLSRYCRGSTEAAKGCERPQ